MIEDIAEVAGVVSGLTNGNFKLCLSLDGVDSRFGDTIIPVRARAFRG